MKSIINVQVLDTHTREEWQTQLSFEETAQGYSIFLNIPNSSGEFHVRNIAPSKVEEKLRDFIEKLEESNMIIKMFRPDIDKIDDGSLFDILLRLIIGGEIVDTEIKKENDIITENIYVAGLMHVLGSDLDLINTDSAELEKNHGLRERLNHELIILANGWLTPENYAYYVVIDWLLMQSSINMSNKNAYRLDDTTKMSDVETSDYFDRIKIYIHSLVATAIDSQTADEYVSQLTSIWEQALEAIPTRRLKFDEEETELVF
jgi:hypothetical protein